jgi:hypothetical protein
MTNYKAGCFQIADIIYTFVVVPFFFFDKGKSFKGTAVKLVITGVALCPVIACYIFYYKGKFARGFILGFTSNFGYMNLVVSFSVLKIFGRSIFLLYWVNSGTLIKGDLW